MKIYNRHLQFKKHLWELEQSGNINLFRNDSMLHPKNNDTTHTGLSNSIISSTYAILKLMNEVIKPVSIL